MNTFNDERMDELAELAEWLEELVGIVLRIDDGTTVADAKRLAVELVLRSRCEDHIEIVYDGPLPIISASRTI